MKSFWVKFGHADARSVVEARCAAVSSSSLTRFVLCCFCYLFMFKVMTFMLCAGVEKGRGACVATEARVLLKLRSRWPRRLQLKRSS